MAFGGGGWEGGGGGGGIGGGGGGEGGGGRNVGKDGRMMGFMGECAGSGGGDYGVHGNWGEVGGDRFPPVSQNYSGSWRLLGSTIPRSSPGCCEEIVPEKQKIWPSSGLQWPQDQQRQGCLVAK